MLPIKSISRTVATASPVLSRSARAQSMNVNALIEYRKKQAELFRSDTEAYMLFIASVEK